MKRRINDEYGKFWSGFALGAGVCGVLAITFGTKQGRETLRKTMEYLERVEGTPDQVHQLASAMQKIGNAFLHDAAEVVERAVVRKIQDESRQETPATPPAREDDAKTTSSPQLQKATERVVEADAGLSSIIDRMRNMTAGNKAEAKFFKKTKK
ncbi:MAG: hypothetical protein N2691_00495 [Patescibacteria group bacterium]|nr:hypothetical protein [Patescibacteria group bacterium]